MSTKPSTTLLLLLGAFLAAFALMAYQFHASTERYAIREAEKLVQDALLTHRAIHRYVNNDSRPEIYRLKREGKLYEGYFSPKTMSFTYQARGIKDYLNKEREAAGLPPIYFKLASDNPRNEINRADARESELLRQMNAGTLTEHREIIEQPDGTRVLYVVMATAPVEKSCLRCHGDPKDAPAELVEQYPEAAGYHEKVGDIRALISIRVPLDRHLADGRRIANILTLTAFGVLAVIYALIWYFIRRNEAQKQLILEKNRTLERLSVTDYLTDILNRHGFMKLAGKAFESARRYARPFSLIMIDLDHFKEINDTHGHDVGDQVLRELARLLTNRVRCSDILGRLGGEELIIAPTEQDIAGAEALAEQLRAAIEETIFAGGLRLTASFGVAELTDESSLTRLLVRVDHALYRAKAGGRNRVSR